MVSGNKFSALSTILLLFSLLQHQRWLQEALESFTSQPSETDLLKAALTVLKVLDLHDNTEFEVLLNVHVRISNTLQVHKSIPSHVLTDEQQKNLEVAFEQVKYFIEDLDHANGLR